MISALGLAGDPWVSVLVASYRSATFQLGLTVAVEPDYANASSDVLAAVEAALRAAFSFAQRDFGQPVMFSEVVNVAQNVTGVLAVSIADFYRSDSPPASNAPTVASPGLPCAGAQSPIGNTSPPRGAELLTLDPAPLLSLTVMS